MGSGAGGDWSWSSAERRGLATSTVEVSLQVLLATDSADFADSFRAALEEAGCRVALARSSDEALAAAGGEFEGVLLDLDLPDIDAMAVLRELRRRRGFAAPPVILLKGEGAPVHVVQQGLDIGASGYILKDRFPRDLSARAVIELFRGMGSPPEGGEDRRKAPVRPDACPFSVSGQYDGCAVFLPLDTSIRHGDGPRITCSHLRIGTVDTWGLYPRCALGAANARANYLRDQTH